jgi:hypothetical protein
MFFQREGTSLLRWLLPNASITLEMLAAMLETMDKYLTYGVVRWTPITTANALFGLYHRS